MHADVGHEHVALSMASLVSMQFVGNHVYITKFTRLLEPGGDGG